MEDLWNYRFDSISSCQSPDGDNPRGKGRHYTRRESLHTFYLNNQKILGVNEAEGNPFHDVSGFRMDYEIISPRNMKKSS